MRKSRYIFFDWARVTEFKFEWLWVLRVNQIITNFHVDLRSYMLQLINYPKSRKQLPNFYDFDKTLKDGSTGRQTQIKLIIKARRPHPRVNEVFPRWALNVDIFADFAKKKALLKLSLIAKDVKLQSIVEPIQNAKKKIGTITKHCVAKLLICKS